MPERPSLSLHNTTLHIESACRINESIADCATADGGAYFLSVLPNKRQVACLNVSLNYADSMNDDAPDVEGQLLHSGSILPGYEAVSLDQFLGKGSDAQRRHDR
jgi:hypothetical protein